MQAIKKGLDTLSQKINQKQAVLAVGLMTMSGAASATTTPSPVVDPIAMIQSAFASVTGIWDETNAQMWMIGVPIVIGFIGLRLFKRGANAAVG